MTTDTPKDGFGQEIPKQYFDKVSGIRDDVRKACEELAHKNTYFPKQLHGNEYHDNYVGSFNLDAQRWPESERMQVEDALQKGTIVDLCCGGADSTISSAELAHHFKAPTFIGVEQIHTKHQDWSDKFAKCKFNGLGGLTLRADVREFLQSLPPNSVNFLMTGIDWNVWASDAVPEGYVEDVKMLMMDRCLPGGVLLLDEYSRKRLGLDHGLPKDKWEEINQFALRKIAANESK